MILLRGANPPHQIRKAWVGVEGVEARVDSQLDEFGAAILVGSPEPFEGPVCLPQAHINEGDL
jgi:hypothetical protein